MPLRCSRVFSQIFKTQWAPFDTCLGSHIGDAQSKRSLSKNMLADDDLVNMAQFSLVLLPPRADVKLNRTLNMVVRTAHSLPLQTSNNCLEESSKRQTLSLQSLIRVKHQYNSPPLRLRFALLASYCITAPKRRTALPGAC